MLQRLLLVMFLSLLVLKASSQTPPWQWAKDANSNSPETSWDIAVDTSSGNIYVGGSFQGNLSAVYGASLSATYGNQDGFLAKYDPLGNVIWALKIGGIGADEVHGIAVDPSGDIYVTGYFNGTADFDPSAITFSLNSSGGSDGFLAKYNAQGTLLWAVKFGGSADEDSWKMEADANGVYITGSYESVSATFTSFNSVTTKSTTVVNNKNNMFGAKYNSSGVAQWVISGGSDQEDIGFNVISDATHVYFIGRYDDDFNFKNALGVTGPLLSEQQNNKAQVYIAAFTQAGLLSWQTNITSSTGGDMVVGWGIAQDATNLYVTGYFDGNINFKYPTPTLSQNLTAGGNLDLYLAKLSKAGTFLWNTSATGNGNGEQIGRAVNVDASGNVILSGAYTNGMNYSSAGGPNFATSGGHDVFVTAYSNAGGLLWSLKAGGVTRDYINGMTVDNVGGIYICGEQDGAMAFGTTTLTIGGAKNVFLAKTGCASVSNNSVSASQTICVGAVPLTFTGSAATGGTVYTWQRSTNSLTWTNAAGTFSNQNYSAPTLTATTYFRRIASAPGSCSVSSLTSNTIQVLVIPAPSVANAGTNQTICASSASLSANSPAIGFGIWSVLSGTATVTSPTNPASPVTGIGTGTNQLLWTTSNAPCAASTSTLTIIRNVLPTSSAGANQTVCATSAIMTASTPTVGFGAWTVLLGSGVITSSTNPASAVTSLGNGINQFAWTVTNGVCPAATSTVAITRDIQPLANAGTNQTVCTANVTLAALSPAVGTGMWSVLSGTGIVSSVSNPSASVSSINVGVNQFVWTVTNGTCSAATSTVSIIRHQLPVSNAGLSHTVCTTTVAMSAVSPTIGSGQWSLGSGSGNINSISNPSTVISALGIGSNSFVWTVTNGVCPPAISTVIIVRDQLPVSNAGSNQTVCTNAATLAAVSPTLGTGLWTVLSGTGAVSSPSNATSQVTSLSTGTNQFVWTVSNGTCPAVSSTVTIKKDALPSANAGSMQSVCSSTATLAAVSPSIGNGQWSLGSGSGTINSVSNPSTGISALGTGSNSFIWTVTNGVCPPATSTVIIARDQLPVSNAGFNQTVCTNAATLAAVSPTLGTGLWTVLSGTGTVSASTNATSQVTSLSTGTNQFVWTVTNGVCPAVTSTASIIRLAPLVANAGTDQTICVSTTTMSATPPSAGSGVWSILSGSGNINASSNPTTLVNSLSTGTNQFVWTVTNGICPAATSTVNIIRKPVLIANAGSSQTICSSTTTLNANSPVSGSGVWTVLSGTSSVNANSNPTSAVSGLSEGANGFLWTVTDGICPAATASVLVWNDKMPTANAGIDQNICSANSTLQAVTPTLGIGLWSVSTGTANLSSLTASSPSLSAIATGTTVFVWTVTNGVCPPVSSSVTVIRDAQPTANAGTSQTLCSSSATLGAIAPAVGNGVWTILSGNANFSSLTDENAQLTALNEGTNAFVWTVSNGVCQPASSTVIVTRDAPPTAFAGTDQTLCIANATLSATQPTLGSGSWAVLNGSATLVAPASVSSAITGISTGTNTFVWTVTNGICAPVSSTVHIMRDSNPGQANAGLDFTICAQSSTLSALPTLPGSGAWSVLSGGATVVSPSNPDSEVSNLSNGINSFVWSNTNGSCPASTDTVEVYSTLPLAHANAGDDKIICSKEFTLSANNPGYGAWTIIAGNATVGSVSSATTHVNGLSEGSNIFVWTVSKTFCPTTTDTVKISRDEEPETANAGVDARICGPDSKLNASEPSKGIGEWLVIAGSGSLENKSFSKTELTNLNPGVNSFAWIVTNGVCPSSSDTVQVISDAMPSEADAGADRLVCEDNIHLNSSVALTGKGLWSLVSGTCSLLQADLNTSPVEGLKEGIHVFKWTISNGVCPEKSDTAIIQRTFTPVNPDAGADLVIETSTVKLNATIPQAGVGTWSLLSGSCTFSDIHDKDASIYDLPFGNTVLKWTIANESCPDVSDEIVIRVKNLNIPNAFSPNGDGINDRFVITSLDYYKEVKFSVFNRWGNLLYNNADYHNDWSGVSEGGERLADDTYYYIIEIPELKNFTGFIIIKRD